MTSKRLSVILLAAAALPAAALRPAAAGPSPAIDAMIISGVAQDFTAIGRVVAGGLLGFGHFGVDAHLTFEGFLRLDKDQGVSARSFGLIDLGVRYGFRDDRFHGPYLAAGAGFGIVAGNPRERKLTDDTATCEGYDQMSAGQCTFEVDKNISTRLGLGWGFASGKRTTVGVRVDLTYWLWSVADEQERFSPPAREVARPQDAFALMVGLEFMRWQ